MGFQYIEPEEKKVVKLIEDMAAGKIHAITFTSPPSARNLFTIAKEEDILFQVLRGHLIQENGVMTAMHSEHDSLRSYLSWMEDYLSEPSPLIALRG